MANQHPVRLLMLEDNPLDAELIERELRRAGLNFYAERVDNGPDFRAALESSDPDMILADYSLPTFDGISALQMARTLVPDVPFIFVSGSIGEERAIHALREGATDYIIKDRLPRLAPAITRARDERRERQLRQRAQAALQRSEERFQYAAQATQEIITDRDLAAGTLWMSDAIAAVWGYRLPDNIVPASWWDERIHPDDRAAVCESRTKAITSGMRWTGRYRFLRADQRYAEVFDRGIVVRDRNGLPARVISAVLDVSERSTAEAMIQKLSDLNELILESAVEGIIAGDATGRATLMNRAASEMTEYTLEELKAGPAVHDVIHHHSHDGTPNSREECAGFQTIRDGRARTTEETFWKKSGEPFIVVAHWSPILENGTIVGLAVFFQDITERQTLERQLAQAQRVSSLGRVAATIAHEFNNVLMGIQPFAEILLRGTADDDRRQKAARQILSSVARGKRVTEDILRFTQPAQPALHVVELNQWLVHLVPELRALVGNRVDIQASTASRPMWARCDPVQLQQVVTNLVINARDAMPQGGVVTLKLGEETTTAPEGMVCLEVRDTGVGMTPDVLENIFEPLFTTKRSGTGLGLAVAQQVIARHGGSIRVTSRPGEGTSFHLLLPAAATEPAADEKSSVVPTTVRRVLVVDDDVAVVEGLISMLEEAGIEARAVHEGGATEAAIRDFDPDAVILDIGLPDVNGFQVLEQIRSAHPAVGIVLSTGHARAAEIDPVLQRENVGFLRKPYDSESLLEVLSSVARKSLAAQGAT
jgi:PAS domain S-box-containing protein